MSDEDHRGSDRQWLYVTHMRAIRTDVGRVVGCPEDELGSAVVARADVADVGLARDDDLGGAKVAELEDTGRGVEQQVLGLDVAMADADGVDVHEGT